MADKKVRRSRSGTGDENSHTGPQTLYLIFPDGRDHRAVGNNSDLLILLAPWDGNEFREKTHEF